MTTDASASEPANGQHEQGRALMHIGTVAERTELSLRTLRHYDNIGLVTPSGRSEGGFRLYSENDVQKLLLIRRMKPLDFSLADMKAVLDSARAPSASLTSEQREQLTQFAQTARERRQELERKLAMADELVARLEAQLNSTV